MEKEPNDYICEAPPDVNPRETFCDGRRKVDLYCADCIWKGVREWKEDEDPEGFIKNCGEYVLRIENDHADDLWCRFLKTRADPMATRQETNTAGNDFVREFNRLGISIDNPEDES